MTTKKERPLIEEKEDSYNHMYYVIPLEKLKKAVERLNQYLKKILCGSLKGRKRQLRFINKNIFGDFTGEKKDE